MSESDGNTAVLIVEMWVFLSGFSCPTPTLLPSAPKLLWLGEATHSELLGTKRVNKRAGKNCQKINRAFGGRILHFTFVVVLISFTPLEQTPIEKTGYFKQKLFTLVHPKAAGPNMVQVRITPHIEGNKFD